jgi:hypothetical protein
MKKKTPVLSSRRRIVRAVQGLRKTPGGGLVLDERSLEEDRYTEVKTPISNRNKERKTA